MMALQNAIDPAATAIAPGRGPIHPTKDKEMNSTIHSTGEASSPAPTISELTSEFETIWSDLQVLQRKAYLLVSSVEKQLDEGRGQIDGNSVTLCFQKRVIDVTTWLAGEVWSDSADLIEKADKLYHQLEALQ